MTRPSPGFRAPPLQLPSPGTGPQKGWGLGFLVSGLGFRVKSLLGGRRHEGGVSRSQFLGVRLH